MSGGKLSIFIPISKIDEEQRLVYGEVASEVPDNAGETFDYDGSKPYFQKWSDNAYSTSGGKSYGNLRVMHTSKVAGLVSSPLGFDDENKTIQACTKVVDDDEWKKVLTGCYTGFSMGGRYVERINKGDEKRYVADPVEISLVDKPCIPTATFEVIKADGSTETRNFAEGLWVTEAEILGKADDTKPYGNVKYADPGLQSDGQHRYPIDTPAHIRSAWSYINQSKNASEYSADDLKKVKDAIIAAWKTHIDKDGPPSNAEKADNGESQMPAVREPTNDEMLPIARELAKAAGKSENDWLDFMDGAREQLIQSRGDNPVEKAEHSDTDCKVENCAKCAETADAANKGDNPFADKGKDAKDGKDSKGDKSGDDSGDGEGSDDDSKDGKAKDKKDDKADKADAPELEQVWKAKDGSLFTKKADALSHNEKLAKGEVTPSLADQLRATAAEAEKIAKGEVPDDKDQSDADVVKIDDVVSLVGGQLEKLRAFGEDPLVKGLYNVQRLASITESLQFLHSAVASETQREGDGSSLPESLLSGLKLLGQCLVDMAAEEVHELVTVASNAGDPDVASYDDCPILELSAATLGLEKGDLVGSLQKRNAAPDGILAKVAEANARADMAEKSASAANQQLEEMVPLVKSLQASLEDIKKLPMPKAPTTHVLGKGENADSGKTGDPADPLNKYTMEQLRDAAIRMAHQHGQTVHIGTPA